MKRSSFVLAWIELSRLEKNGGVPPRSPPRCRHSSPPPPRPSARAVVRRYQTRHRDDGVGAPPFHWQISLSAEASPLLPSKPPTACALIRARTDTIIPRFSVSRAVCQAHARRPRWHLAGTRNKFDVNDCEFAVVLAAVKLSRGTMSVVIPLNYAMPGRKRWPRSVIAVLVVSWVFAARVVWIKSHPKTATPAAAPAVNYSDAVDCPTTQPADRTIPLTWGDNVYSSATQPATAEPAEQENLIPLPPSNGITPPQVSAVPSSEPSSTCTWPSNKRARVW